MLAARFARRTLARPVVLAHAHRAVGAVRAVSTDATFDGVNPNELVLDPYTLNDFAETDITTSELGDYCNRHRTILTVFNQEAEVAEDAFVAETSTLVGRVTIQDRSSVGYGCVLRADTNYIHVGANSHILDQTCVQTKLDKNGVPGGTVIGNFATIGPNCSLATCLIDNRAFVGAGCIIQDHSWVAENAMLAPGSVLPAFSYVPPGQVWAGNPAQYVRDATAEEKEFATYSTVAKHETAEAHKDEFALPVAMDALEELATLRTQYRATQQ